MNKRIIDKVKEKLSKEENLFEINKELLEDAKALGMKKIPRYNTEEWAAYLGKVLFHKVWDEKGEPHGKPAQPMESRTKLKRDFEKKYKIDISPSDYSEALAWGFEEEFDKRMQEEYAEEHGYKEEEDKAIVSKIKKKLAESEREKAMREIREDSEEGDKERKERNREKSQYKTLNDGVKYEKGLAKGDTEIWYKKRMPGFMIKDVKTIDDLLKGHVLLGKIKDNDLDDIMKAMQGEFWSEMGEANNLIRSKGLTHTSMSVGDIIKNNKGYHIVAGIGFKKIELKGKSLTEKALELIKKYLF
ncbi:hypothetical protein N9948_01045 [bacterium]|nr:hypothetical protein [bacterium]